MENQKYFINYRKLFLFSAILNTLVFVFLILVFFGSCVKNISTNEEYGLYQFVKFLINDEVISDICELFGSSFISVSYFMFMENTIFTLLLFLLLAAVIASLLGIVLGIYHYVCYKKVVNKIVEKRKACNSFKKFKKKTGLYTEDNTAIFTFIILVLLILFSELSTENADFCEWIFTNPLGIYFSVFLFFEVPMNAGLIIYLSILLLLSIISKILVSNVRHQIYSSVPTEY